MKKHTTNYINTLIEASEDCPVSRAHIPPEKKEKTIASLQYEQLIKKPYQYTSDDIIFACYVIKNGISDSEMQEEREKFFSKGQPCLRCSPLAKKYGFGFHHNSEGKVALFPIESKEYQALLADSATTKAKAMRTKRK